SPRAAALALVGQPAVGLVELVALEGEVATGRQDLTHRVGAGGNRLRLERLHTPVGRHLGGNDALQVVLDGKDVDRQYVGSSLRNDPQLAAVAPLLGARPEIAAHCLQDVGADPRRGRAADYERAVKGDGDLWRAVGWLQEDLWLSA